MKTLLDLNKEYTLELGKRKYRLIAVAGHGGSSIVYKAREEGGFEDYAVIKEFCPHNLTIQLMADGSICVPDNQKGEYEERKSRALSEAEIVDKLRHDDEIKNNNPWFLSYGKPIEANNTLYTVIATESGDMLSAMIANGFSKDKNFIDVCDSILKILTALKPIHDQNYLHLDISPDNIHFSGLGIARLIDYNSAFRMGDDPKNWMPSYKPGYSAKELTDHSLTKPPALSFATDLYSVAAIFFRLLVGRTPEEGDWSNSRKWQLSNEAGYLAGASNLLVKETNDFLRKGLSLMPARRFNDVEEMRAAIMRLMELKNEYELVSNPKYANKYFVCRESELEQIDAILNEKNYVILEGMGGIGKTELVKKYAEKYKAEYDIVQFVTFSGNLESTIAVSLLFNNFDASRYTKIHGDNAISEMYRDKIIRLKDKKYGKRTLIVMDNYNTPHDDKFSEFTSGEYKVIFTSREKHEGNVFLEINNMENKADLLALFRSYYAPSELAIEDEAAVNEIIGLVLGHTMTVMLIASAMRKNRKTPKEMFERLQNSLDPRLRTKIAVEKEGLNSEERSKVMYEHVQTLFDMTEIHANGNYSFVMTNMALVPYTGLDIRTFYDWALREYYESQGHDDEYYGDLEDLIERRWIQSSNDLVSLHPVISDVAGKVLIPDSKKCVALIQSLIKFAEDNKDKTHAERVKSMKVLELACKRVADDTEAAANLSSAFASAAYSLAKYDAAIAYYRKASGILEKTLGAEHPDTASSYNKIGHAQFHLGKYSEALEWYRKVLDVHGAEHSDTVTCYNGIAEVHRFLGEYYEALKWLRKALVVRENILGAEHPDTADSYNRIASVIHGNFDEYREALEWLRKALAVYEKVLGAEHPDTAATYNSIADVHSDLGEHREALEWRRKELTAREKAPSTEHPDTAANYIRIADIYSKLGEHCEALKWHRKALTVYEKVHGTEHPGTAASYNKIGIAHGKLGKHREALKWQRKALAVHEKALGVEHPITIALYEAIGSAHGNLGEHREALEWYRKVLALEKLFGAEHFIIACVYFNIGKAHSDLGEHREALEWHHKALAVRKKVHGTEQPATADSYNNIGLVHNDLGEYREALEWHHKALAVREKVHGTEHTDTASSYNNIGVVHDDLGEYREALEWYHKALAVREKVLGTEHTDTADTYNNIGLAHNELGEHRETLEWYHKALAICEKALGTENANTAIIYNNIGKAHNEIGEHREALEWFRKALAVREKVIGTEHIDTADTYNNIGLAHDDLGEHREALEWFRKALTVCEKVLGTEHINTANSYNNIGNAHNGLGKHREALEWYRKALVIREKLLGKKHPKVMELYNDIARLEAMN